MERLMRANRGFTLIELLVVICIIGLLAAILFPVFARARENARRTSCASNLKQVALGLQQYISDYDARFPPDCVNRDGNASCGMHIPTSTCVALGNCDEGWAEVVQPYLKSPHVYQCPSNKSNRPPLNSNGVNYTDYWLSYNLFSKSETVIKYPAMIVMNGDGYYGKGDAEYLGVSDCGAADTIPALACNDGVSTIHLGGANYAFADGHVKWFKGQDDGDHIEAIWDDDLTETTTPKIGTVYSYRF